MPDITGSIRTKKLGETGITEDHLATDWKHPGAYRLAVVELRVEMPHGPDAEGNRKVDYVVSMCEPVPEEQDERMRSYMRTLYRLRPEQQGQAVLTGTDDGETAEDALGAVEAGLPEWDGNPEPADDLTTSDTEHGPDWKGCPFPGCILREHDDDSHEFAPDGDGS